MNIKPKDATWAQVYDKLPDDLQSAVNENAQMLRLAVKERGVPFSDMNAREVITALVCVIAKVTK